MKYEIMSKNEILELIKNFIVEDLNYYEELGKIKEKLMCLENEVRNLKDSHNVDYTNSGVKK